MYSLKRDYMIIAGIHLYFKNSIEIHAGSLRQIKGPHDLAIWCPGIRCHVGAVALILLYLITTGNDAIGVCPTSPMQDECSETG